MGIQVGGEIFSHNNTIKIPDESGTLATQEYVQENAGGLPTQTGNNGKYLKTDGTAASWDTPAASLGYLVYTANITQTGTDDPIATVQSGNTVGNIVWTRNTAGEYYGTLTGAFVDGKTIFLMANGNPRWDRYRDSADRIVIDTYDNSFVAVDDGLNASIEVRIYP